MSDSIISSAKSEFRWAEQVLKTFNLESVEDPPCVFRVTKSLRETKPQVYAPQKIGLGPYHHLRPEFYVLQRQKIAAVKRFLKPEELQNFQNLVLNKLVEIEPIIRTCYNEYIDISGITLALILAIDGVYLLDILTAYSNRELSESAIPPTGGDLFMLENQVPSLVLNEIRFTLKDYPMLSKFYLSICKAHSPLKLTEKKEFIDDSRSPHLLAYMYHLIVNNRGTNDPTSSKASSTRKAARKCMGEDTDAVPCSRIVDIAPLAAVAVLLRLPNQLEENKKNAEKVIQNLKELRSVVNNTQQTDNNKPADEEIDIPSASELDRIAKVTFKKSTGGIRDVHYNKEECELYLPEIKLKSDSEVILRNLVAYEAAMATPESNLELAEYVDLMCGIVDNEKDVTVLKDGGIIASVLDKKEIAEIFNGIRKSTGKSNNKSQVNNAIRELNERYDENFGVKVYKFLKGFIGKSWKLITLIFTILLLLLLMLQSLCQIFGCNNWFGESAALSLFLGIRKSHRGNMK